MNTEIHQHADPRDREAGDIYDLIAKLTQSRAPITNENDVGERGADRVALELPVNLGIAKGTTRDISATGVFFETDANYPLLSSAIHFEVEFDTPNGKALLKCFGEIIRVEPRDKRVGVAVKILDSWLERA